MLAGAPAGARIDVPSADGLAAYLRARAAAGSGEVGTASADYARALAADPNNARIAVRAYREALDAGDDALARRAVRVLEKAGAAPADAALLALADAARLNDPAAADVAIARLAAGPLRILGAALGGWTAFARAANPLLPLEAATGDPLSRRLASEQRALLLIARGDADRGAAAIRAVAAPDDVDLRLAAAELLAGQGRGAEGRALLTGTGPAELAYRAGASARPTLAFGVSRLLTRVAADLARGDPSPLVIALTRAALAADPGDDRARLILATALARAGRADAALAVLAPVAPGRPLAGLAAATRISILNGAGRMADALAAARAQADAPTAVADDWQRYADLLFAADRFAEAAIYYGRAADAEPTSAQAWMQYGGALDRAGQWHAARAALERAAALAPADPLALNYLGYARLARGEAVAASSRLIERASALDPDNADITDSLGWAYYLAGDTGRALPLLERASAAQPATAEIGEHLGDAYWTVGRRYEARYAWRAAALTAPAADAARLADKIASGLPSRP